MGVDYYAKSIIGVKIAEPKVAQKVRGCNHAEGKGKYCAECGKPMFFQETCLHPILETLKNNGGTPLFTKLGLVWGTDQEEAYVGFFKNSSSSSRSGDGRDAGKVDINDIDIPAIKKALQEVLGELYNEKNFGLWTVLYCSY